MNTLYKVRGGWSYYIILSADNGLPDLSIVPDTDKVLEDREEVGLSRTETGKNLILCNVSLSFSLINRYIINRYIDE